MKWLFWIWWLILSPRVVHAPVVHAPVVPAPAPIVRAPIIHKLPPRPAYWPAYSGPAPVYVQFGDYCAFVDVHTYVALVRLNGHMPLCSHPQP